MKHRIIGLNPFASSCDIIRQIRNPILFISNPPRLSLKSDSSPAVTAAPARSLTPRQSKATPELEALAECLKIIVPGVRIETPVLAAQLERMLLKRGVALAPCEPCAKPPST